MLELNEVNAIERSGNHRGMALNTASGRTVIQQPGSIATILLLVFLLAFRVHACPMPVEADIAPPDIHHCCPDAVAPVDTPADPGCSPGADGPCLQAFGKCDGFQAHVPPTNEPDPPALIRMVEWLPPDGARRYSVAPSFIPTISPPPPQRSRVLRL